MSQQARIRRLRDTLSIAGGAVIAFSIWSLAKVVLFLTISEDSQIRDQYSLDDAFPLIVLIIVAYILGLIDLAFRVYVGMSARSEAHGKKKRPIYLIVAVIAAIGNTSSTLGIALGMGTTTSPGDAIISIIIEATSLVALVMVVYCAVRLRRLNKATG